VNLEPELIPAPSAAGLDYFALNAMLKSEDGDIKLANDHLAAREYHLQHVNTKVRWWTDFEERIKFLLDNDYYEQSTFDNYPFEFIKKLTKDAYARKYRFATFMGAYKFYGSYALKSFDGEQYLERIEDRIVMTALTLARGNQKLATQLVGEMLANRFQPATPTFLNSGKAQRGELVSCFLLRIEDNMESIAKSVHSALQLSKRGGGVAFMLSNIREFGAPIKKIEGQSAGIIPVMKQLEVAFNYANQLGARDGAGAVYLNAHHPDILRFLDTKRENADEAIRIKTLSLGVVLPDITLELVKADADMYTFSPYDVERFYGIPFGDISVTEKYYEMLDNPSIRKVSKFKARKLMETIAEIQFESGYPYLVFEDTVNRANPIAGRINMSNLCSEILQVNAPAVLNEDGTYAIMGKDISCNLGSLNIAMAMDGPNLGHTVETAIRALTSVSDLSHIKAVPTIESGNDRSHAIGLGQMNLAGFLAREHIHYDSPEAVDFTNIYFYTVLFHALTASNKIAIETETTFDGFENSTYASGAFFDKYTEKEWKPATRKVAKLWADSGQFLPDQEDWKKLARKVIKNGIYNQNLQAVPPTGSISYINNSTASIHPIVEKVEIRKEGKTGRVYVPAPFLAPDTFEYFRDAYEVGPQATINVYAAATQHVDQGLSMTLFFPDTVADVEKGTGRPIMRPVSTRDINLAQNAAFKAGIKTIYYIRIRQTALDGTGFVECVSCSL
jgi:ribonucleoside-diphosphate reductase alpha chain